MREYIVRADMGVVDRAELVDINDIKVDARLDKSERISSYLSQIKNPYCYRDGDTVICISYADTEVSLEDRLRAYACGLG